MAKTKAQKTSAEKRVRMSTRRSANFTHHEKQVLLSLMQDYRQVVEDRHTDGVTVREKNTAWIDLTNKYNTENDVSSRSIKQLRQCWKNLKSRSRVDFISVPGEGGSNDSTTTLALLPPSVTTSSSSNVGSAGSGSALTIVMSNSPNANEGSGSGSGSSPSNNTSTIDNAGTIILNNILTNNSSNIIHNNSNNIDSLRATNGIGSSGDLSPHSGSPGLTSFSQSLTSSTTTAANRPRPESKTSSSNKKRKKKAPTRGAKSAAVTAVVEERIDEVPTEVTRSRRKTRPTLVHLNYDENGVLDDQNGGGTHLAATEMERPRRKTRPSVMHLDYVNTSIDEDEDEEDEEGADEEEGVDEDERDERLQVGVGVGYPHDSGSAVVVSGQQHGGHSHEPDEDMYSSDTLAVVSVSGSADRIHFNNLSPSSPHHLEDIHNQHHHPHHQHLNLQHPQTGYRLGQHNSTPNHHIHISSAFQQTTHLTPNSNHLQDDLNNHTDDSGEPDIKVFDSIRGFGKVLHTQNALPTHLVSHVTDGRTVHSVNLGPSINYSDGVDIVNSVPSSSHHHSGPQIVSTIGGATGGPHIPSIEPVLLEKVSNGQDDDSSAMGFHKTEHSERMKNIRLERKLISVEHRARMELIKLKSEYVKMKMETMLNDRS